MSRGHERATIDVEGHTSDVAAFVAAEEQECRCRCHCVRAGEAAEGDLLEVALLCGLAMRSQ